ncbi:MAG: carbohydrate kinase family protein [Muribaculaceae bacterium]|nr:carbohydrate kinase family protein [Muribaculaceae bacterium]
MKDFITVIGGANIDISATMSGVAIASDSNPGHVTLGHGGVARNVAHNLCSLGHEVRFVTVFGNDNFGKLSHDHCQQVGLELSMCVQVPDSRNGLYLCVNNRYGELVVAVAETDIINNITPEFLLSRMPIIGNSKIVVADTNLPTKSLKFLIDNCTMPLVIDAVSTAKAARIITALEQSEKHRLHTLKLNRQEALAVSDCETIPDAAQALVEKGVENVYITLGAEGVYCSNGTIKEQFPTVATEVVNATGAGDAFVAGVVHGMILGEAFPLPAHRGQRVAAATLLSQYTVHPDLANFKI